MTAAVGSPPPAPSIPPPSLIREMPPEERPRQRLLRSGGEALADPEVRAEIPRRRPMHRPARVARYLALRYGLRDQEVVGALYLDVRNRLIAEEEVFRGALTRTTVEPRQVIGPALNRCAAGVVIFHNHPSGDPTPSPEDVVFTRRMATACEAVGIALVDHLILAGPRRWVSMRKRQPW